MSHSVSVVRSWAELTAFAHRDDADGCVVDADSPSREEALAEIRHLRGLRPELAVIAYADVRGSDPELLRLGAVGVDGVLLAGRPPWASGIRRAADGALAVARARWVERSLRVHYPPAAAAAVAWAVEHAAEVPSAIRMAAAVGHTSRSLTTVLRAAGLPAPARVLLWGRLLYAGALLGRDARTVEDAALRLGYSTATAFARAMKRETGHTPRAVARGGGLAFVQARLFRPGSSPHENSTHRSLVGSGTRQHG